MSVTDRFDWGIDRETETATWSRMVAGALFVVLAGWFVVALMLASALVPGYEIQPSAISDLGVAAESALLFNGTLVLVGALNVVGGYFFYRSHGTRWLLATFVIAGIGAIGAGIFTLEMGALHSLFALLAFIFFNVEAIGTGMRIRGPMVIVSVLLGAIGLVFVGVMAYGDVVDPSIFGPIGHGGAERMIVYPAMVWLLIFGGYLLGSNRGGRSVIADESASE